MTTDIKQYFIKRKDQTADTSTVLLTKSSETKTNQIITPKRLHKTHVFNVRYRELDSDEENTVRVEAASLRGAMDYVTFNHKLKDRQLISCVLYKA